MRMLNILQSMTTLIISPNEFVRFGKRKMVNSENKFYHNYKNPKCKKLLHC